MLMNFNGEELMLMILYNPSLKTGRFIVGCATRRPTTAPAIMQMNMKVVM